MAQDTDPSPIGDLITPNFGLNHQACKTQFSIRIQSNGILASHSYFAPSAAHETAAVADTDPDTIISSVWSYQCHSCFSLNTRNQGPQPVTCQRCNYRVYCSEECKATDRMSHDEVCFPLEGHQLEVMNYRFSVIAGFSFTNYPRHVELAIQDLLINWVLGCQCSREDKATSHPMSPLAWKFEFNRRVYYHYHVAIIQDMPIVLRRMTRPLPELPPGILENLYSECDDNYPSIVVGYTITDPVAPSTWSLPYIRTHVHHIPSDVLQRAFNNAIAYRDYMQGRDL